MSASVERSTPVASTSFGLVRAFIAGHGHQDGELARRQVRDLGLEDVGRALAGAVEKMDW